MALLASKLFGPIAAAAAAVLLVLWLTSLWHVHTLKNDLADSQATVIDLKTSINEQNDSISRLAKAGEVKTAAASKAVANLQNAAEAATARATVVLAAKPSTCAELDTLILESLK